MKAEDLKPSPQTQAQNSASNSSQKPQLGRPNTSTTSNRKGRPSKASTQVSSQPLLRDTSNVATNFQTVDEPSNQITVHEDLFKTLGMGFNERNHINLVANTLIQQIQAHVLAALGQSAVSTTTKIEPSRGIHVHVGTPGLAVTGRKKYISPFFIKLGLQLVHFNCNFITCISLMFATLSVHTDRNFMESILSFLGY